MVFVYTAVPEKYFSRSSEERLKSDSENDGIENLLSSFGLKTTSHGPSTSRVVVRSVPKVWSFLYLVFV